MAGHSKWANIQHRKGRQDARRGKLFSKLIREVTVAAKLGGGDPHANPRLRAAVEAAKSQSLPKDTIERAIKRGAGGEEGGDLEEARYEGYGPGGVAVLVDCLTDNRKRTVAEVRHAFSKHGGKLGTDGSVAYLFHKAGLLVFPSGTDEDALMEAALEAGAEDVINNEDGSFEVLTAAEDFFVVKEALERAGQAAESAALTLRAQTSSELDAGNAQSLLRLLDVLDELDDVQQVYSNAAISGDVLAQLS